MYEVNPIDVDRPCGEAEIEYTPEFIAFRDEFALLDGGESRTRSGNVWSKVRDQGLSLLRSSQHVNIYFKLALVELLTRGLLGFHEALQSLASVCEQYWSTLHPQADPDDPEDLLDRTIALEEFSKSLVLQRLFREQIIGSDRVMGTLKVRDILVAENRFTLTENSDPAIPKAECEQILMSMDTTALTTVYQQLSGILDSLNRIQQAAATGQPSASVNLAGIINLVKWVEAFVRPFTASSGVVQSQSTDTSVEVNSQAQPIESAKPLKHAAGQSAGINGPQDVIKVLDQVIKYYQDNEPSSPVPFLLRRAKRLVNLDFVALVRDLSPHSIDQVKTLFGIENEYE